MKIQTARVVGREQTSDVTMYSMLVILEDSEREFVLFSWDANRLVFGPDEVVGYEPEKARDRVRAKAALLMQEDAVVFS